MKNLIKIAFIFFLILSSLGAAQVVVKTDTLNGTPLVMSMEEKINSMLESVESNCHRTESGSFTHLESGNTKPLVKVLEKPMSNVEICRKNPRIMGFKIQLAIVKSNKEADEVKAYFRRRFPSLKAETDASLRPNYKVLAGSYFSKDTAAGDLKKIREFFKSATTVQYRVFCVEAK